MNLKFWKNESSETSPPVPDQAKTSPLVLIIDDEPEFLRSVSSVLTTEGFKVMTAGGGVKGLTMLRYTSRDIKVVVVDYSMPQLNGAETLTHLRKMNPDVKVIAISGLALDQIPEAFIVGPDRFLQKPFPSAALVTAIREILLPKP